MLIILIILMLLGIIPCPFDLPDGSTLDTSNTDIVFVSKSCGSCIQVKQIITRLQRDNYDVILVDIHGTRYERQLATKYHVYQVPVLVVRTNGIEINRKRGALNEGEYRSLISKNPVISNTKDLVISNTKDLVTSNTKDLVISNTKDLVTVGYSGVLIFVSKKQNPDFISARVIKNTKKSTNRYVTIYLESNDPRITKYSVTRNPTIIYLYLGNEKGRYIGNASFKN